jgi:hypothetical protein
VLPKPKSTPTAAAVAAAVAAAAAAAAVVAASLLVFDLMAFGAAVGLLESAWWDWLKWSCGTERKTKASGPLQKWKKTKVQQNSG